jgi:ankyrin repeat protein
MVLSLLLLAALQIQAADVRLLEAVKKADKVAARALLDKRADVNARAADGATALHWAVHKDDLETAGMLIRAGANVKAANPQGVTPLSLASLNGSAAMIELLLKAGADPNTALPEGETVLMTAARTGKLDAVKALIARGADVNAKESWRGQTALMWAAAEGHADVVQALVERHADVTARSTAGFTPLLFAVREGKIGAVRALLEAGADVNETLPLTNRRRPGNSTITEAGTGPSALVLAVANAHYELAALLLDRGADPNAAAQGWTALHHITWVRKPGAGSNNPAPEGSGNMSSLTLVRKLAAHGANLNARVTKPPNVGVTDLNMLGGTPFLLAARTADAELMRVLAEFGADPLLPNDENTTPLMVAAGVGVRSPGEDPGTANEVLEAVKIAWELGGDVNAVDKHGQTAMHGAAYKQVPAVAQFLIEKGAKIDVWNRKNMNGWTPLRIAVGVHRGMNFRSAPAVAAVLTKVMSAAGLSTEVEPEGLISGTTK